MKRETVIAMLLLLGVSVLALWVWAQLVGRPPTGLLEYFTLAAYSVGGVIVFSILAIAAGQIWLLVRRALHPEELAREARKVWTRADIFHVDGAGANEARQLSIIRLVPSMALVIVEFDSPRKQERIHNLRPVSEARLSAMRAIVNDAVERIKRDAAPETWVDALPEALARLREHDLMLCGPSSGGYRYDPQEVPGMVG